MIGTTGKPKCPECGNASGVVLFVPIADKEAMKHNPGACECMVAQCQCGQIGIMAPGSPPTMEWAKQAPAIHEVIVASTGEPRQPLSRKRYGGKA